LIKYWTTPWATALRTVSPSRAAVTAMMSTGCGWPARNA
jgi:hypothetical protein